MTDKKGSERLDTRSTDAYHWAECFCEEFNIQIAGDLHPWFANYWAAVHDPLARRVDELEQAIKRIEEARKDLLRAQQNGAGSVVVMNARDAESVAIADAAKMLEDV